MRIYHTIGFTSTLRFASATGCVTPHTGIGSHCVQYMPVAAGIIMQNESRRRRCFGELMSSLRLSGAYMRLY